MSSVNAERDMGSTEGLGRVVVLALLGYAFIFFVLLVQILLAAWCVKYALEGSGLYQRGIAAAIALGLFYGVYLLFQAIFARFGHMEGVELPADAPLYQAMREISAEIGSPAPRRIFIDDEFNASAGVNKAFLPWRQDAYITVGVPLAAALTPEELKAVLAHELGHHSRKHSRIAAWVYRVRWSWQGVDEAFDHLPDFMAWLVERFYDWYIPVFQKQSFAVARANEYEADAVAAQSVGAEHLASSLCRLQLVGGWLEDNFWPAVFARVEKSPQPPERVLQHLNRQLGSLGEHSYTERFLGVDADETGEFDTHPCLRDRVEALGLDLRCPEPVSESALGLFGPHADAIVSELSGEWREANAEGWRFKHERLRSMRDRIGELTQRQSQDELSLAELNELGELHLELDERKSAFRCFKALHARRKHPMDLLRCARLLAALGELDKARKAARAVLGRNPEVDRLAVELLFHLRDDDAEVEELERCFEAADDAADEREELYADGRLGQERLKTLSEPALPEDHRRRLTAHLESFTEIEEAHLVRLETDDDYPDCANYVLFISTEQGMDEVDDFWAAVDRECWHPDATFQLFDAMDELKAWAMARRLKGAELVQRANSSDGNQV